MEGGREQGRYIFSVPVVRCDGGMPHDADGNAARRKCRWLDRVFVGGLAIEPGRGTAIVPDVERIIVGDIADVRARRRGFRTGHGRHDAGCERGQKPETGQSREERTPEVFPLVCLADQHAAIIACFENLRVFVPVKDRRPADRFL
jgi:hypothetical protein